MSSDQPAGLDLALTDPIAIVHAVADHLAARWVDLCWATLDGVWQGPAEVVGCAFLEDVGILLAVGLPTDDHETIEVNIAWRQILSVGGELADHRPERLLDQVVTVSRWFGHQLEITQHDRAHIVGTVIGFDLHLFGDEVDAILVPADPVDRRAGVEYAVAFDDIANLVDRGPRRAA